MDNRGLTPAVGKLLAAGIAALYVASVTGLLLGSVVPDYRTGTASELSDRVLATAAADLEDTLPRTDGRVTVLTRTPLPDSIRGERYRILIRNRTLVLDHPADALDARAPLALPPDVTVEDGAWTSDSTFVVRVTGRPPNRTVSLLEGSP